MWNGKYKGEITPVEKLQMNQVIELGGELEKAFVEGARFGVVRSLSPQPDPYSLGRGTGSYYLTLDVYQPKAKRWDYWRQLVKGTVEAKVLVGTTKDALDLRFKEYAQKNFTGVLESAPQKACTLGADPELFVKLEDSMLPAFDFLPGKAQAKSLHLASGKASGIYAFWDGAQAEFVIPAGACMDGLVLNIQEGLRRVLGNARAKFPKAQLYLASVVDIPQATLKGWAKEHSQFGCMPSLNVYGIAGATPEDPCDIEFRPAGGHIHLGLHGFLQYPGRNAEIIRTMDATLGVMSVGLFAGLDDPRRRMLYGLPGEYREPVHGIEYRTLSNSWLAHPAIVQLVYSLARRAAVVGVRGLRTAFGIPPEEVVEIIRATDVDHARKAVARNEKIFKGFLESALVGGWHDTNKSVKAAYQLVMEGLGAGIEEPTAMELNWGLEHSNPEVVYNFHRSRQWSWLAQKMKP